MAQHQVFTLSKGPQFRGGKSAIAVIPFMMLLTIFVAFLIVGFFLPALILFPLLVLLAFYILDVRGIQIDRKHQLIRTYKFTVLGRRGEWRDLEEFDQITLNNESYSVKEHTFNRATAYEWGGRRKKVNYTHWVIRLAQTEGKKTMILAEDHEFANAKNILAKYAEVTGLPIRNKFNERLRASKQRKSRSRSKRGRQ